MIKNEKILCVSRSDWDDPKRMRHHIMYLLAKDNDVLWVEKPISFAELGYTTSLRYTKFLQPVRRIKPGLRVLTPPPTVPLLDKLPLTDQVSGWLLLRWLKAKLRGLGFRPTILWVFDAYAHRLVGEFGEGISLFHCNDTFHAQRYLREERKLIQKVNLLITLSEQLNQERKQYNPNCHVVLHGVDLHGFPEADPPIPDDLASLPRPIIAYVGVVSYFVDLELLKYIARRHPEWSIVVVGPIHRTEFQSDGYREWQCIGLPNFYLLGPKSQSELPAYYRWIDVALYPITPDSQTAAVQIGSKFFEYLIMGRPVVSTNFGTYKGVPPEFYEIAKNKKGFVAKIEKCLAEDTPARQARRRKYARQNSLQLRLKEIACLIQETRAKKEKYPIRKKAK